MIIGQGEEFYAVVNNYNEFIIRGNCASRTLELAKASLYAKRSSARAAQTKAYDELKTGWGANVTRMEGITDFKVVRITIAGYTINDG